MAEPGSRAASSAQPDPTSFPPPPNADRGPQFLQGDTQHGSSKDNKGVILGNLCNLGNAGKTIIAGTINFCTPLAPQLSTRSKKGRLKPRSESEYDKLYPLDSNELVTPTSIASDCESQGNYEDALSIYNANFSFRRKHSGAWNVATLEAAYDIARTLEKQGRNETALTWYNEIFEVRQNTLGNHDSRTLKTACSVARILERQGRRETALKWYDEVFKVRRESLGNKHPETLEVAYNVADILELQGRNKAALKWYMEILEVRKEGLDTDRSETLRTEKSVERVLEKMGRCDTASK